MKGNTVTVDTLSKKARTVEILLVEDNRGDVLLTKKAFSKARIANRIEVANSGEQAMEMLHKRGEFAHCPTPDIILLDLNLPKKDGKEVLQEIKADPDLRRIPVIILTSSLAEKDVVKSYNLNANSYIVKPVDLQKFAEVVSVMENFWFTMVILPDQNDAAEVAL